MGELVTEPRANTCGQRDTTCIMLTVQYIIRSDNVLWVLVEPQSLPALNTIIKNRNNEMPSRVYLTGFELNFLSNFGL